MLGNSTCPHCKNMYFEIKENNVQGANYRLFFVQCTQCNAPFAAMEYYDSGALLKDQEKRIESIEHKLSSISSAVSQIGQIVTAIANRR